MSRGAGRLLVLHSNAFPYAPEEAQQVNPQIFGLRLAQFLELRLPDYGVPTEEPLREDWGWMLPIAERHPLPLWIGCADYGTEVIDGVEVTGFACFVEPSPPIRRRLFKRIDMTLPVRSVEAALERALRESGHAMRLDWV